MCTQHAVLYSIIRYMFTQAMHRGVVMHAAKGLIVLKHPFLSQIVHRVYLTI